MDRDRPISRDPVAPLPPSLSCEAVQVETPGMPAYACGPFVVPVGSVAFGSVGVFFEKETGILGIYWAYIFEWSEVWERFGFFLDFFAQIFLCNFTYVLCSTVVF